MQTLTKADLIDLIYETVGFSKREATRIVEMVFEQIKERLVSGEKVKLSGFGNFVVREKRARMGRNPQTGSSMEISARRVITFKPSYVLKNSINDGTQSSSTAKK